MITVYQVFTEYCATHNLPVPKKIELTNLGSFISTHFRRFWGPLQPTEVIAESGFVLSEEPGKPILVSGYPDSFYDEMIKRIELFLQSKPIESPPEPPKKKERKRIPAKPKPAYTLNK